MYVSLLTILIASSVVFYFHKRISEQSSVHDSYLNSLRPIKYEINCSDSFFAFCSRNAGHPCRVLFIVCANHRGDIESDEYDRTLPFISTRTPAGFIWNISIDLKYQGNNYSINIFFHFRSVPKFRSIVVHGEYQLKLFARIIFIISCDN